MVKVIMAAKIDDEQDDVGIESDDELLGIINEKELEQDNACNNSTSENLPQGNLYYDPDIDKQNEEWMASKRNEFKSEDDKLTKCKSDAVLSCPACMVTVCVDCQRHDLYKNQFRAMFVLNCDIDEKQFLRYEHKNISKKRRKREGPGKLVEYIPDETNSLTDIYNPVKCRFCKTEIAVYDADEIYHFFNVIESLS